VAFPQEKATFHGTEKVYMYSEKCSSPMIRKQTVLLSEMCAAIEAQGPASILKGHNFDRAD
jgi:hypothetical protein